MPEIGGINVFTVQEICELFDLSPQSVRRYLREGKIKARKVGTKWLVTEEAIRAFLTGEDEPAKEEN